MAKAVGIDLGTTNSVVSILEGGEPVVVPNAEGGRTTPSVVGFSKSGEVLVGEVAKRQAITNPDRTIRSVKRQMGTKWNIPIDGKKYTAQEISARILQKLKRDAEAYIGDIVSPLKRLLVLEDFTPISAVEDRILTVIGVALGVELLPFDPAVKLWDRRMLKYERNPSFELEPRYSAETAYICCFKSWKQECSQVPVAGELASREEHLR